jgi:hypothetical protein
MPTYVYENLNGATVDRTIQATYYTPDRDLITLGPVRVLFKNCRNTVIRLRFPQSDVPGISLGLWNCQGCRVVDGRFESGSGKANAVVASMGGRGNRFEANDIGPQPNGVRGFWVGNIHPEEFEYNPIFDRNRVCGTGATCIAVVAFAPLLVDNVLTDSLGAGVALAGSPLNTTTRAILRGNRCSRNAFHGIQADPIDATISDVILDGNLCDGNHNHGILIHGARDWVVRGNLLQRNGVPSVQGAGIGLTKSCERISILDNLATDQDLGVVLSANTHPMRDIRIARNMLNRNRLAGLRITNVSPHVIERVAIENNDWNDNQGPGLFLADATPGDIRGVRLAGNRSADNGAPDRNDLDDFAPARAADANAAAGEGADAVRELGEPDGR